MRPYLVLTAVLLLAVAAMAQQPIPRPGGYVWGPYVPLITTPEISFEQYSPNPVGATNATTGLIAGATNSTLSQVQGPTSSVYSVPVWLQGGDAPIASSQIHLFPEHLNREGRVLREEFRPEERPREERAKHEALAWNFIAGREHTADAEEGSVYAKSARKAAHVYTNDDVTRQNDKNGTVKHDGKTEKMQ